MKCSEYLVNTSESNKNIQIVNQNNDVLYWGIRRQVPLECLNMEVMRTDNILNIVDVVTVK